MSSCWRNVWRKRALPLACRQTLRMRLARATVEGSGELMHRSPEKPVSTLREEVTSPGGTTAAALAVLMGEAGLSPLMQKAVEAAKNRAGELSG